MVQIETNRISGKIVGLGIITVLTAFLFGYVFRLWFAHPNSGTFLALILIALFWLILSLIAVFVVKRMRVAALIIFLEMIGVWVFLDRKFSLLTLVGLLLLFLGFLTGFERGRMEIVNALKIRFSRIAYRVVPGMTTGLILFFTLYLLGMFNPGGETFQKSAIDFFFRSSESVTVRFVPGFSTDKSVNEVLRVLAASRLPQNATNEDINEAVGELKMAIEKGTGVSFSGSEQFTDAIYRLILVKLSVVTPAYRIATLAIIGLTIFVIVKGLAFLFHWIIVVFGFLLYKLLLGFNFMNVRVENASQEVIVVE